MVEDLVAISRLEDSSFPLRAELVPLDALLCSVLAAYALEASGRSIMLAFAAGTDSKLWADPALLRRVLENVLDNAFRHTPDTGHIAVDVQLGEHVEIVISNNGPPIPLDERERIFEKFVRGRAQVSTNGNAGLGLYFCKRAMEAHGGGIRVREIAEWPASFVLHLPRSGARVAQPRGALPA
jgi:signal transduction histidine kinase